MRFTVLFALLPSLAAATPDGGGDPNPGFVSVATAAVDGLQRGYSERRYSAAALAVVDTSGRQTVKVWGIVDASQHQPINPEASLFAVGSITKTLTALELYRLRERGQIASLEDAANKYLKRVQVPDNRGRAVTLQDLITHTAGFDSHSAGLAADAQDARLSGDTIRRFLPPFVRARGQVVSYSNFSYGLLGIVIEDVTGLSFDAALRRDVLSPLGMHHTRVATGPPQFEQQVLLARGPGQDAIAAPRLPFHPFTASMGAMAATPSDMARYMRALLGVPGADGGILNAELREQLFRPRASNQHELGHIAAGWWRRQRNGHWVIEHSGTWPGYTAMLTLVPDSGVGIFVAIAGDSLPPGRPLTATAVRAKALDALLGQPAVLPPGALSAAQAKAFAGRYLDLRLPRAGMAAATTLLSGEAIGLAALPNGDLRMEGIADYGYVDKDTFVSRSSVGVPDAARVIGFTRSRTGAVLRMTDAQASSAYEKIPAWQDPSMHRRLVAMLVGLLGFAWLATLGHGASPARRTGRRLCAVLLACGGLAYAASHWGLGTEGLTDYVLRGHSTRWWLLGICAWVWLCTTIVSLRSAGGAWRAAANRSEATWIRWHACAIAVLATIGSALLFKYGLLSLDLPY